MAICDPGDSSVRGTHDPGAWHKDTYAEEVTRAVSGGPWAFSFSFFYSFYFLYNASI